MKIATVCDLRAAWDTCTILGKIFFFWLMLIGWIGLFIVSFYLTGVVELGTWAGFFNFEDEPEENKETD